MEYFLYIDNLKYYHWQTELLIESFKINGCDKKLFLYLLENPDPKAGPVDEEFLRNINSHPRKDTVANIGKIKGCTELNKIYMMLTALSSNSISQPFFILSPDMVLRKEIATIEEDGLYPSFLFCVDPFFTLEEAEKNVGPFYDWLNLNKEDITQQWIPIGESYGFNNLPIEVFYSIARDAEKLAVYQMLTKGKVCRRTCDIALIINIIKLKDKIFCRGNYNFISPIDSSVDSFLITYKDGCLPSFHKSMFMFEPPINLSFGNPIKSLSELTFSPNSNYVAKIARSILEK